MLLRCRDSCSVTPLCQSICYQAKTSLSSHSQPPDPTLQSSNLLCRHAELKGTTARYLLLMSHPITCVGIGILNISSVRALGGSSKKNNKNHFVKVTIVFKQLCSCNGVWYFFTSLAVGASRGHINPEKGGSALCTSRR